MLHTRPCTPLWSQGYKSVLQLKKHQPLPAELRESSCRVRLLSLLHGCPGTVRRWKTAPYFPVLSICIVYSSILGKVVFEELYLPLLGKRSGKERGTIPGTAEHGCCTKSRVGARYVPPSSGNCLGPSLLPGLLLRQHDNTLHRTWGSWQNYSLALSW